MLKKYPLAFVSCVVGILSFFQFFGLEKAVLAIVLGAAALKDISEDREKGKKYAYAGIILGSLYVAVLIGILIYRGPALLSSITQK